LRFFDLGLGTAQSAGPSTRESDASVFSVCSVAPFLRSGASFTSSASN
jgi:hypothetical protein